MTEQYRKLTSEEVKALYNVMAGHFNKPSELQNQITEHVRKYYPREACSAILTIDSEYNDNTYDNSIGHLVVYNKAGVEIVPNADTARESRKCWSEFNIPNESSEESVADIVVHLATQTIPELYIKKA